MRFDQTKWDSLGQIAPVLDYPSGVGLFRQGAPALDVYCIREGMVKLVFLSPDGGELIVALCSYGKVLGAFSAILHETYPVSAETTTPCQLVRVPADAFLRFVKEDGFMSWQLHEMHSRMLSDLVQQVAQLGCVRARDRLENIPWSMLSGLDLLDTKKPIRLQPPLKYYEIAKLIAVTPQYLSSLLGELEREGLVCRNKGSFLIADPNRLWHLGDRPNDPTYY